MLSSSLRYGNQYIHIQLACGLSMDWHLGRPRFGAAQNPLNEIAEKTPQNEGHHSVSSGQTGVITL
jgi:hypothetical protein